jgi:transcriptional regulator with XRE-family HTH domain
MPRPFKQPLPELDTPSDLIGERLAALRKSRGITQTQLAEQIGISQYLVSSYETGRLHLSDDMLIRLAKALGTTSDSILGLGGTEPESPSLRLVKRLKKIEQLPLAKQKALLQTIDGFLKGEGI